MSNKIRWKVFLPPWLIMLGIVMLNLIDNNRFVKVMDACTGWILGHFTGAFCFLAFISVLVMLISYFSPVANMKVGGEDAKPIVTYQNYLWIILCTIMAAGILFWACAEPMYHLYAPPQAVADGPGSAAALVWAMDTMFLEWTITPMCIYGVPALLFAFVFYNMKESFSLGSMLAPLLGKRVIAKISPIIDAVCLFALCAGMSASLGQGVLLLSGGIENYTGGSVRSNVRLWTICTLIIVVMFIISAATGVTKGIRLLSNLNVSLYAVIGVIVIVFGQTTFLFNFGIESIGNYFKDFLQISLFTGASGSKEWVESWPGFYWCNWLAWMPITAVFMGKISKGFTFKQVIRGIVVVPAVFSMVWIALFSGSAVFLELKDGRVYDAMQSGGTEAATFVVLRSLPAAKIIILLFLTILLISFVTAADSNTNAMSSICTRGITVEDTESPMILKIVWGLTIGTTCIIMLGSYGVDGIKKMSNLGGFPDGILMVLFLVCWIRIIRKPEKFSKV